MVGDSVEATNLTTVESSQFQQQLPVPSLSTHLLNSQVLKHRLPKGSLFCPPITESEIDPRIHLKQGPGFMGNGEETFQLGFYFGTKD